MSEDSAGYQKEHGKQKRVAEEEEEDQSCDGKTVSNEILKGQKLCGYLKKYKIGARGKSFKRRWFVLADNTCTLLYYRSAQDIVPLGEIDIACASFSFNMKNINGPRPSRWIFEITTHSKTYCLEANNKNTLRYWLQELQRKRSEYNSQRLQSRQYMVKRSVQQPVSGLVSLDTAVLRHQLSLVDAPVLTDHVDISLATVGEASGHGNRGSFHDLSITNWRTELRNIMAIRGQKKGETDDLEVFDSAVSPPNKSRLSTLKKVVQHWKVTSASAGGSTVGKGQGSCHTCKELEEQLSCQKEDLSAMEEELAATREIMKILQKHIDTLEKQNSTKQRFSDIDVDMLGQLQDRDRQIVHLEHLLTAMQEQIQVTSVQLRCVETEVSSLREQAGMYVESIQAKDQIIVSLTNGLHQLELDQSVTTGQSSISPAVPDVRPSLRFISDTRELDELKDMCTAFQEQNNFLNKEILELNKLRENDAIGESGLLMEYTETAARLCQLESKYLVCLQELTQPRRGGEGDTQTQEMVSQLLQEAMDTVIIQPTEAGTLHVRSRQQSGSHTLSYDEYGFSLRPIYEFDQNLEAAAKNLQKISDELSCKAQNLGVDMSNQVKWENYFVSIGEREIQRSRELKLLIRTGIPLQYKERIWKGCVHFHVGKWSEMQQGKYYEDLLQTCKTTQLLNPALKQIELDLLRTLPHNKHYQTLSSEGICRLRRVLSAYSLHNPLVGYCQGINRLAALSLLFLNEEDAFWCLVAIIECIMPPEYYSVTLAAAHTDQNVLKYMIMEKLPRLHAHLLHHKVDISLFTFNWFLTVFVDNVPVELYLRIWDAFLYEGSKVLFRFAVAFFKYNEDKLLELSDSMELFNFLRTLPENITNFNRVCQIAFDELNPFPMRLINSKRELYLAEVKVELQKLDKLRSDMCTQNCNRADDDYVSDGDDA
ncbi:TBC1 domain family member 2B [Lamellibrachia satsuma]|nr:TBC1 domain family member 2B [Lamellibrachia satsuma]